MTKPTNLPRASARRISTQDQILDAAEELFSRYGLHDVMLRDVTSQVGVDHSLVHYYFKDKQDLFDAVVARRTPATSEKRMAALEAYEREASGNLTVEGILRTYLDIDSDLSGKNDNGCRFYGALAAQMRKVPEHGDEEIDSYFDPVALKLISLLKKALPDCPMSDVFWGYHFATGALMLTLAQAGRIDRLSGGTCDTQNLAAVKDRLACFMAAGFRHVQETRTQERSEP